MTDDKLCLACKAACLASCENEDAAEAYKIARDELTMMGPVICLPCIRNPA